MSNEKVLVSVGSGTGLKECLFCEKTVGNGFDVGQFDLVGNMELPESIARP